MTKIFTDGSCIKKPHNAWGAAACTNDKMLFQIGDIEGTNQLAELSAIEGVLEYLKVNKNEFQEKDIQIISDSIYAIKCMTEWRVSWEYDKKKQSKVSRFELIKSMWKSYDSLSKNFNITFKHVMGHGKDANADQQDINGNKMADKLATNKSREIAELYINNLYKEGEFLLKNILYKKDKGVNNMIYKINENEFRNLINKQSNNFIFKDDFKKNKKSIDYIAIKMESEDGNYTLQGFAGADIFVTSNGKFANVNILGVVPDFRKNNYGKILLENLERIIKESHSDIKAIMASSNEEAEKSFLNNGFEKQGERFSKIENKRYNIRMVKNIV